LERGQIEDFTSYSSLWLRFEADDYTWKASIRQTSINKRAKPFMTLPFYFCDQIVQSYLLNSSLVPQRPIRPELEKSTVVGSEEDSDNFSKLFVNLLSMFFPPSSRPLLSHKFLVFLNLGPLVILLLPLLS